ncbi:pilus assembly protein PilN [Oleiphilus sp. HI0081]|uniref:PilN domain-containing protein n=4 Tax=Oleiphilus TaxID=141450 RepID=UPI0007C37878|nr:MULTISPECIES: PilN domain-containing protein [unclassified Oleiphilus]KZY76240.1 pilus assembly protein PilN [Oleiphilus sp. HI0068]KZY85616.1 pilus assembly protein PilN [Oleiphilus sp. HI0072]KZY88364.1 pilus assembly protein PilN [Oleiphilus sp. HI0069]KZZ10626.1 pilus assembly protein PilN [Oleiphilus sp. HI0078]KZZ29082.1 pilus assembly protein PilN [Oleiphilus sp. HI0081]KZZ47672.1 pilus assembly protein PilN [Oleiphilus sp. HI0085]
MPSINLRPWREELRAEKQRNFITSLIAVLVVAVVLVFLWQDYVSSEIETQKSRNNYLSSSMAELDKKIKEIKELKKEKKELLDRMKVIQDLQGTRPVIVRVMDELVRTLPDGLYYESLERKEDLIEITGLAESNNRISGLMRNFETSVWFSNPNLKDVSAIKGDDGTLNSFDLSVKQVTPELAEDQESSEKGTK